MQVSRVERQDATINICDLHAHAARDLAASMQEKQGDAPRIVEAKVRCLRV